MVRFIGEEGIAFSADSKEDALTWYIDPIDGTTNFVRGIPFCCVSLGLWHGARPLVGVIYAPILDELYIASAGQGALLNGKPMKTSTATNIHQALVISQCGLNGKTAWLDTLSPGCIRAFGSAALEICSVAAGRADAFILEGCKPWDYAGAVLIAKEAGAFVGGADPSDRHFYLERGDAVVAASESLAAQMYAAMQ